DRPEGKWGADSDKISDFAIPLGLALLTILDEEETPNFRRGEYSFPTPWKRYQIPFISYLTACALTACFIWLASSIWFNHRIAEEKAVFADLMRTLERPYTQFEESYANKAQEMPKELKSLSSDEFFLRINHLQNVLAEEPESFLLYPDTALVSDTLAWLASQPEVLGTSGKPQIDITTFSYQLVKRPEMRKKNEKYRIRVELDFTSQTPKAARQFHDALLAPNAFVDPKNEVKWTSKGDSYRVSFFLKNKPPRLQKRAS
ncbi:MAG: hypothetical protein KDK48_05265, partial [Chlamydiia bacterium]|nr:hypothetical protein [Chlamydiia bacterium]